MKALKTVKNVLRTIVKSFGSFVTFSILLFMFILENFLFSKTYKIMFLPQAIRLKLHLGFQSIYLKTCRTLDKREKGRMTQIDLVELSLQNLLFKKTRTMITLGGVSIGFGAIVFLVSIGYGTQNMVVSRVARLDELRQADLTPQLGSKNKLNDKILADIKHYTGVEKVLPVISVVGNVNYKDSVSDVPVYAVTSGYLTDSAVKPLHGKIFDSDKLMSIDTKPENTPVVAGVSTNRPDYPVEVKFNILPNEWVRVRESPSVSSKIVGMTKRADSALFGDQVEGGPYQNQEGASSNWVSASFTIYKKDEKGFYQEVDTQKGFVAQTNLVVEATITNESSVLGVATSDTNLLGTTSSEAFTIIEGDNPDFVTIPEEVNESSESASKAVSLASDAVRQAVINTAAVEIFGLTPQNAVGQKIDVSFTATSGVLGAENQKIETIKEQYEIVAVVPDDKSPIMYVPFIDLKSVGITNYSQARLYATKKDLLPNIRKQVEALGFSTRSASDTVERINSLFATVRLVLGIMGTIALVVASLGMFNTFTVSLLERTREVGLMKAMGMKSTEVQKLFLTEAMIMGFAGGGLGILVGFIMGKILDLILTSLSLFKGQGTIGITHIPLSFVALIAILALLVGILTGIYPSIRAKRISALNALRYE